MQTTIPPQQPKRKQSPLSKTREQISAFVIFVNAGGEIEEE